MKPVDFASRNPWGSKVVTLISCAAAFTLTGCSGMQWLRQSAEHCGLVDPPAPSKLLLIVNATPMKVNGEPDRQGMMCRMYVFADKNPLPVKAYGDLAITAFDMANVNRDGPRQPEGKYDVPADKLASHLRRDMVGDSYLFWLPFDPPARTQVSVQATLRTRDGREIVSDIVSTELEPSSAIGASAVMSRQQNYREIFSGGKRKIEPVDDGNSRSAEFSPRAKAAMLRAPIAAN